MIMVKKRLLKFPRIGHVNQYNGDKQILLIKPEFLLSSKLIELVIEPGCLEFCFGDKVFDYTTPRYANSPVHGTIGFVIKNAENSSRCIQKPIYPIGIVETVNGVDALAYYKELQMNSSGKILFDNRHNPSKIYTVLVSEIKKHEIIKNNKK